LVLGFRFFGYQVLGFLGGSGVLGFGGLAVARYRISLVVAADARRARVISASASAREKYSRSTPSVRWFEVSISEPLAILKN
jgi:hypothetical protein